ncbi:MAG: acyl-CoA dehydratase activase [Desulfosarcina sp.]
MHKGDVAGLDIGSRSVELVVLQNGRTVHRNKLPTAFDPLGQCHLLMAEVAVPLVVATGYGRKLFKEHFSGIGAKVITEIQAYAVGARVFYPQARTVLDIGGQDTKAIALAADGRTLKFEMNDRCAAGTGKFLEFMATALQIPIAEFGNFALQADRRITISNTCTVFAETEATSLMARGETTANIAMGLHAAIISRTLAMLNRVGAAAPLVFAGGVAHNACIVKLLEEKLGYAVQVPDDPDFTGAYGAAHYGLVS